MPMHTTYFCELFSSSEVPSQPRPRVFLKIGSDVLVPHGFSSKEKAHLWVNELGRRLDWRAGAVFRLRGLAVDFELVNKDGTRIKF